MRQLGEIVQYLEDILFHLIGVSIYESKLKLTLELSNCQRDRPTLIVLILKLIIKNGTIRYNIFFSRKLTLT